MRQFINDLLSASFTDPDDRRKARLLNILLLGVTALTVLALVGTGLAALINLYDHERILTLFVGIIVMLAGIVLIYAINRSGRGGLAALLFLLLLTFIFAFSDEPHEVVAGRSLFMLVVPILLASFLLRPTASFVMAGLISFLLTLIAVSAELPPSLYAVIAFFFIALVSWLAARSLELALHDLRMINQELDQRVEDRTQELADSLAENKAILEGIADGVIVFNERGEALIANPAIAYLLNQPIGQIIGQSAGTLLDEQVNRDDRNMLIRLLSGREHSDDSIKVEWGQKTLSVSVAPVQSEQNHGQGTVAVFRDFTREAEIDRMKSAFVSVTSHELRTPLNAILGYADMLRETVYGPLTEKQGEVMDRIIANTGHLLNIVNNLLDQAQIEAGRMTLRLTTFVLADLIEGVESVMSVLAHSKGLELNSYIEADMPARLSGDWQRLRQVLLNLVDNAIKYTNDGAVTIRAYRLDSVHWALEVSDTGVGIPLEAQAQIFDAFQRVDDSVTRERAGAGLGLSIVRQLVTLMGGEIKLTSAQGEGSTFTVVLPLVAVQEGLAEATY